MRDKRIYFDVSLGGPTRTWDEVNAQGVRIEPVDRKVYTFTDVLANLGRLRAFGVVFRAVGGEFVAAPYDGATDEELLILCSHVLHFREHRPSMADVPWAPAGKTARKKRYTHVYPVVRPILEAEEAVALSAAVPDTIPSEWVSLIDRV